MVRGHLLQSEVCLYILSEEHQVGQRWWWWARDVSERELMPVGHVAMFSLFLLEKSLHPHIPSYQRQLSFREMSLLPELMQLVNR